MSTTDHDYSVKFEDMSADEQKTMFDAINAERKDMKMAPLKSYADVTRKHAPATIAQIEETDTSVRTRYNKPGQRAGRGTVRLLSDKQVNFIKSLMAQRNTASLVRLPGSEDIENMSLAGARDLIDKLLACPAKAGVIQARMATDKQVAYAISLTVRKMGQEKADSVEATAMAMTMSEISTVIERLKAMPDYTPAKTSETVAESVSLEGMHKLGDRIFKVQTSQQSGREYAKELIDGSFEYTAGAIRLLSAETKMSLEDAKAYGKLYGTCCVCARTLTRETSIEAGIGPICAGKF